MTTWNRLQSWLRAMAHRSQTEHEMDAELRFHIDAYTEDLVRSVSRAKKPSAAPASNLAA